MITEFKYTELESHNDIYFWYQSIYDLSMNVDVYFDGTKQSGTFSLEAGNFDTEKGYQRLQKVIEGKTGGTTYSFDRALLVPDGGNGFVIDSASLVGGNIYARRHDTDEIVQYDRNSASVELYYKVGYRISFHVTGAIENVNTVDGKYQFTDTDPYERQIADGEERTIPIKIGQGYHVKISYGSFSYDSSMGSEKNTQDNQIRDYALVIADVDSNIDVNVEFIKDDITLDYSHYYIVSKDGIATGIRENWHNSDLIIGGSPVSVPTPQQAITLPAPYVINGSQVSIQVVSEVGDHQEGATWILDTFALNRQNVDIPDDRDQSVGETTSILDSAGEKIADAAISVSIRGITRTYNIEIKNITAPLKITSFNLMGSTHSEVILDSKADGVTVRSEAATSDGRPVPNPEISKGGLIYGLDGTNMAHLTLDPEFGYYIPENSLKLTDSNGVTTIVKLDPLNGNPWHEYRTTDLTYGSGVSRLSVGTELVDFVFDYGGKQGTPFNLGINASETPAIDASITPDAPAGEVFIGWKLKGHEDIIYLPDGLTTISKATLMAALSDGSDAVEYSKDKEGQAVIYLEPYFKNAGIAEDVRYRVTVTIPDLSDETFPKAGHYFGTKGENLTRDIVLQIKEIGEYVSQYAAAYQLSSDSSFKLRLENAQEVYDFHLIYIASYADVSVENAADSDHGTITHSGNVVGEVLKFSEGELVTFGIEPKEGFAIKEININGTPKSPLELGSYTAPHKFTFSYKVLHGENSIIVTYGEDRDGNDVPDDEEVRITFISEHGFNDGASPYETVQKEGEELKVPVPMDTDSDSVVFTGWKPELPLDKLVPSWKEGGYTFTAVYAADADNDGKPDEDPGTDDPSDPGTDDPGTGGGTASNPTGSGDATPSGPVSVQQSGNSKEYYYTAGLHGNWVHMDNVDMNVPLDEPVPAGATAVDFPEWHRWRFYLSSGVMLDNQWAHIENPYAVGDQPRSGWFYFDHDGLMRYGWYLDTRSGDWYYMHSESDGMLGTMMTGWHYDSHDNRWYYLDPQSGAMKTGWQNIGGKWYYFNPTPFGETWTLDHSTSVWRFNGNTVRPYGSMYQNEVTPDGYKVGEDGAWIQ